MKALKGMIWLAFVMFSCNGSIADQGGLDWKFYKKKAEGSTVKILCSIPDLNEFNYIKSKLKPLLKDSFGINALIYFVNKERIVKTLLDDSKRNNKIIYDIVIADPDVMQSLFALGLLYGKFLNTLPNNKELDYTFINALKPYSELRDFMVPYSCNQYVMLFDSCDVPEGFSMASTDISKMSIVKDENSINSLFYLYSKSLAEEQPKNSRLENKNNKLADSIALLIKTKTISAKEFVKQYKNDHSDIAILRKSQSGQILNYSRLADAKIKELGNDFPVYYKMVGITNTSTNVSAAMVALNELISKAYQIDKYIKSFEDDIPIFNLSLDYSMINLDSTFEHIEFSTLNRSKLNFSVSDIRQANKWWKDDLSEAGK